MLTTPFLMLANERPLINVDITILMIIGLWLVLYVFLKATFWKPVLNVIVAREEGTEGLRKEARKLDADSQKAHEALDAALHKARASVAAQRVQLQNDGRRQEGEILALVRDEVNRSLAVGRTEIEAQRQTLQAELRTTIPGIAAELTTRLLRRAVQS